MIAVSLVLTLLLTKPITVRIVDVERGFAPSNVEVQILVPPDEDNRRFYLAAQCGDEHLNSSETQLDGEEAHYAFLKKMKLYEPCDYIIGAVLFGKDGKPKARDFKTVILR